MARMLRFSILFTGLVITAASAAHAQYMFLDSNRDGVCSTSDYIGAGIDSVDVWLDTTQNGNTSPAVCSTGETLSIDAYEIIVRGSGITFLGYANKRPEFTVATPLLIGTTDATVGYATPSPNSTYLPAGRYLLGTFAVQFQGGRCPYLFIVTGTSIRPSAFTGFRSECTGSNGNHWITLPDDFVDVCGMGGCDGVEPTTWGRIKVMYR